MKKPNVKKIRAFVEATIREDWWNSGKGVDNSKAIIPEHKGRIPKGTYFLCDCIGNTIDLCIKTERQFRNSDGRLVACKVIETIIPDCHAKFGSALNGCWVIPTEMYD